MRWRERVRWGVGWDEGGKRGDEGDEGDEGEKYTMGAMLQALGIDPVVIGFDAAERGGGG